MKETNRFLFTMFTVTLILTGGIVTILSANNDTSAENDLYDPSDYDLIEFYKPNHSFYIGEEFTKGQSIVLIPDFTDGNFTVSNISGANWLSLDPNGLITGTLPTNDSEYFFNINFNEPYTDSDVCKFIFVSKNYCQAQQYNDYSYDNTDSSFELISNKNSYYIPNNEDFPSDWSILSIEGSGLFNYTSNNIIYCLADSVEVDSDIILLVHTSFDTVIEMTFGVTITDHKSYQYLINEINTKDYTTQYVKQGLFSPNGYIEFCTNEQNSILGFLGPDWLSLKDGVISGITPDSDETYHISIILHMPGPNSGSDIVYDCFFNVGSGNKNNVYVSYTGNSDNKHIDCFPDSFVFIDSDQWMNIMELLDSDIPVLGLDRIKQFSDGIAMYGVIGYSPKECGEYNLVVSFGGSTSNITINVIPFPSIFNSMPIGGTSFSTV